LVEQANRKNERADSQPTRVRWIIFALACAASWLLYLHRYAWGIIRPDLKTEMQLSDVELGYLDSAFSATYAFSQIPAGFLGDLFGPRGVMSGIMLLWSACLAWLGFAKGPTAMYVSRAAFGVAQAGCYPMLSKVTRSWFPLSMRTFVQGAVAAFSGRFGGASAYIVVPLLVVAMGWRDTLTAIALPGIALAAAFWLLFRNSPAEHPWTNAAECDCVQAGEVQIASGSRLPIDWSLANGWNFFIFLVHSFTSTFADMLYVNWIGQYLVEAKGMTGEKMIFGMLPLVGGALGGLFGGTLNDLAIRWTGNRRWSRVAVGLSGKVISAGLIAWAVSIEDGRLVMLCLFACKFFTDWSQPTQWGTVTDIAGPASGTVFGVMNTVGSLAGIAAGPAIGFVLQHHGWDAVFYGIAAIYLVSGLSWLGIDCTRPLFKRNQNN
jgi:sugar phosphate permease